MPEEPEVEAYVIVEAVVRSADAQAWRLELPGGHEAVLAAAAFDKAPSAGEQSAGFC
ncbi:MAG: hypothetical protein R3C68_16280 [Myxococcota bacterium]